MQFKKKNKKIIKKQETEKKGNEKAENSIPVVLLQCLKNFCFQKNFFLFAISELFMPCARIACSTHSMSVFETIKKLLKRKEKC
jgi:hypothetical protein